MDNVTSGAARSAGLEQRDDQSLHSEKGITIRRMEAGEEAEVRRIGRRAFDGLESLWVGKPKQAVVAVKDGKIVGAILYKFFQSSGRKVGYLDYAFVDPDFHGQGVGGILYKESADYLWNQGCDALTAVVKDDNVGSWGLLLKNGFTRVSLPEIIRQFGFTEMLRQYFGTPFCIGIGMEYYIARRDLECPSGKGGSVKQLAVYGLANLLLFCIVLLRIQKIVTALAAYGVILAGGIFIGYFTTMFSKRQWHFRLNNGGGLICALVNFIGVYPMVGNWYPDRYENTESFRKEMGINGLAGWIFVLVLSLAPFFSRHVFARYVGLISSILLIYRILAFYPFESFGGGRVYRWKRWVYVLMSLLSAVVLAVNWMQ